MSKYDLIGPALQVPGFVNARRGIDVYGHHEDWSRGTCSSGTLTCDGWISLATNGGAANTDIDFVINLAAPGGLESRDLGGTDNFGLQITYSSMVFFPAAGKQIHFRAKLKTNGVVGSPNWFMGLSDKATAGATPVMDNATISDVTHAGFYGIAGYTIVAASKNDDGGTAETGTTGLGVTTTYKILEVTVIGVSRVEFRIDGVLVSTLDTYPPDGDHALWMTWIHESEGTTTEDFFIPFMECWETV